MEFNMFKKSEIRWVKIKWCDDESTRQIVYAVGEQNVKEIKKTKGGIKVIYDNGVINEFVNVSALIYSKTR